MYECVVEQSAVVVRGWWCEWEAPAVFAVPFPSLHPIAQSITLYWGWLDERVSPSVYPPATANKAAAAAAVKGAVQPASHSPLCTRLQSFFIFACPTQQPLPPSLFASASASAEEGAFVIRCLRVSELVECCCGWLGWETTRKEEMGRGRRKGCFYHSVTDSIPLSCHLSPTTPHTHPPHLRVCETWSLMDYMCRLHRSLVSPRGRSGL